MCGITGWIDWQKDLTQYAETMENMTATLTPRGPDAAGTWISTHCALGHRLLKVMDPENSAQPMESIRGNEKFIIVYNGELYNANELRQELQSRGHTFRTRCDTEVVLHAYMEWDKACLDRFNGMFAFAIWKQQAQTLFMARDRVGAKPLFYMEKDGAFLFGSEPKAILAHPDVKPEISKDGLAEIFLIGPARTPGHGIFHGMHELKPGCYLEYSRNGLYSATYWKIENKPHEDNVDKTAEIIRDLLDDIVARQLTADVPVGTFLSGGLDSSAITALAVKHIERTNRGPLSTFSVDYVDNDIHFQQSDFQPNTDSPWIQQMTSFLNTNHHAIEFDTPEIVSALTSTLYARDFPGMADIDASLYLVCHEIKKQVTVALSGEGADEIFAGYPWFYRKDALEANTFPWALMTKQRTKLLSPELIEWIQPEQYVAEQYEKALQEVPRVEGEHQEEARIREIAYLSLTRFMPTLLDRKDRMSMSAGLEVRIPFSDHRLVEYVWNIPWNMKNVGNREKGILRKAMEGILPNEILQRKKSPYPKTHNPNYLEAVKKWCCEILDDPSSPILPLINADEIRRLTRLDSKQFHFPWFGQLMTGPQLFAYLALVNTWLKEYRIRIR